MQWWQILLLTLYSFYQICDELTIVSSAGSPVFAGFVAGLVMGDLETGLLIGGSLQLMVLGVGTFGGASRIDATSGAVLATAFAVAQDIDPEIAISTIAVPVAALLVYTDILGRFSTTFFAHRVDAAIERFDYKGIERNYLLGALPWGLSRALPVFLALALGGGFVQALVDGIAEYQWLANWSGSCRSYASRSRFCNLASLPSIETQSSLLGNWFWFDRYVDRSLRKYLCSGRSCCKHRSSC